MVGLFFYEPLVLCGTGFHQMTFQMSHLYYGWNGTIPSVLMYARPRGPSTLTTATRRGRMRTRRRAMVLTSNTPQWSGSNLPHVWQKIYEPAPFTASGKLTP